MRATRGKADEHPGTHLPHTRTLHVEDLAVARGGRTVLDGVSFRLGAGCLAEITGPNGVGKSTLLRALAGLLPPARGRVRWTGDDGDAPLPERLHYVGHADGIKATLTVGENLRFAARLLGGGGGAPPEAALADVGLGPVGDVPAAYLSAGQRRRVALARLRVAARPLWLLDEPLTALDAAARGTLRELMVRHLGEGGLILAATHAPLGLPALELALAAA